ncbi:MAG TPA: CocE/NonD family hydrolase [Solirubrobacteraceae bacterium]|nr:CocE/NonD family hydrolase [Solirubrobacteraceae bacterium]
MSDEAASQGGGGRACGRRPACRGRVALVAAAAAAAAAAWLAPATAAYAFDAGGSVEQVYATGVPAHAEASLVNASGGTVATQDADALGGVLFRGVAPGNGYHVRLAGTGEESPSLTVHDDASEPWDPGVYNQEIPDNGYTYLTTRDGTKLAIDVHPPTNPAGEPGLPSEFHFPTFPLEGFTLPDYTPPYPTLIEYSGYGYANPAGPENGIAVLANLMGFAVVDVNMRGTGCSGGAYDFFEPLQNLDGYDVIQTIAKQPWVLDHKVGMMGISYGAISQLFTAQTDPPALEAIAPLSTIDATASTLYPGGILNTGFAVHWAEERQQNAEPASPGHGQAWATTRIEEGDKTCEENQDLHEEAANLPQKIKENATYNPPVADPLDPITFVNKIDVPVFMACQWEDEQTGGHCADLAQHFTGTARKWFTFTNGAHVDSLDPDTYDRWYDFLELYVAHQAPIVNSSIVQATAPVIYDEAMGLPKTDVVTLPSDPIQLQPTYEGALAEFEKEPEVRVLFDNGAGASPLGVKTAGNPYPAFEATFPEWPIPGTTATSWYLGPHGTLSEQPATAKGVDAYTSDASALPLTDYSGGTGSGGLWGDASQWEWNWKANPAGSAASYVSAPLAANTVAIGAGAVHLWVRSSTPDVDVTATVGEISPEGNETFVQNGWLRASERKLAKNAKNMFDQEPTTLEPIPTFLAKNVKAMPAAHFVPLVVPLYFEGHAYRAGSRIRLTIAAPNGTQPVWSFGATEPEGTTSHVELEFSAGKPSSLVLPIVPGVSVPAEQPPCPSLRNEPCRAAEDYVNDGS